MLSRRLEVAVEGIFIFFREGDGGRGIPQWQTTFLMARHDLCRGASYFK